MTTTKEQSAAGLCRGLSALIALATFLFAFEPRDWIVSAATWRAFVMFLVVLRILGIVFWTVGIFVFPWKKED